MVESAYNFIIISTIFPFLLIFLLAGILALIGFGLTLLVNGIKAKWGALNKAGRVFKIIRMAIGIIFLLIAVFAIIYSTVGIVETIRRGGIFSTANNVRYEPEDEALINYLSLLLKK